MLWFERQTDTFMNGYAALYTYDGYPRYGIPIGVATVL